MKEVQLFVEGGNSSNEHGTGKLREALSWFLRDLREHCEARGFRFTVKLCGDINRTFKIFRDAHERHKHDTLCVLLVDADGPVPPGISPLAYLRKKYPKWEFPSDDPRLFHCMVHTMEAWVLADRQAAAKHLGCDLNLLHEGDVEALGKPRLEELLAAACAARGNKYDKLIDGAAILKRADPAQVRRRAPSCERLFAAIIQAPPEAPGAASILRGW